MKAKYLGVLRYISYACSLAAWCSATESTKGFPVLSQPMLHISSKRFTIHNIQQQEEKKKHSMWCMKWKNGMFWINLWKNPLIFFKSKLRIFPPVRLQVLQFPWLFHRDPYNGLLWSLIYPYTTRGFVLFSWLMCDFCLPWLFLKPAVAFKIVLKVTVSQSAKPKGLPVL